MNWGVIEKTLLRPLLVREADLKLLLSTFYPHECHGSSWSLLDALLSVAAPSSPVLHGEVHIRKPFHHLLAQF